MIQYRSVYPKVLAFAICKALHIQPPHIIVQTVDGKTGKFYTQAVEL